jgi:universal stress protein A
MPAIDRILAATDFSAGSERALEYAEEMAHRFGAEIVLLHVDEAFAALPGSEIAEDQRRAAERELEAQTRQLAAKGLRVRALLRIGLAVEEIVGAAEAERADLVVMGTHGRSGLSHLLMGSVAERVVRRARCPVLTVRPADRVPEGRTRP